MGLDGWTHSLRAKGRKVGAPFADWKIWPNTLRAHQLLRFAPRASRPQLKKAMFEAIYENGENVSDPEVVCRLASEAGVDVEGFRKVLDTPAAQQDVRRACAQASQRGVRGVPYFVVSKAGRTRAQLASPAPSMRRSSSRSSARSSAEVVAGFERS